ncbi:MAG: 3',5'-cyclic-nucleotide phosphodiesterase [Nitrosomonadales bacterium]|nr:MAG: 3',5'-cyclic-nucleotide phosphodiesterase [Nitrosomonadales bacterium]
MKVEILGCSGGIGGILRTTALLVDDDILIDAGTGVGDLSIEQLIAIDHIFLTHSHLDHVTSIPFLVDTVIGMREKHITVHATSATWQILKDHIFNWKVWPDFSVIPDASNPFLRHSEIRLGETVELNGRSITPLPANHAVPAVGFQLDSGNASLVFSGDTTTCDALWEAVNNIENLKYLIIETAFSNGEIKLAEVSMHLCPSLLIAELRKLRRSAQIYITHLKPGEGEVIMAEVERDAAEFGPLRLHDRQIFTF